MATPINISAPFSGVDESQSRKLIAPTAFSAALNIILRDGKPAPRPGYEVASPIQFASAPAVVQSSLLLTGHVAYDGTNGILFFAYQSGSNYIIIAYYLNEPTSDGTVILTTTSVIGAMACDPTNSHLYFVKGNGINRITYAGASETTLVADARNGSGVAPQDLTLDLVSGTQRMYWTTSQHVMRAVLAGTSPAAIFTGGGTNEAIAVAVDPSGNRVYWSNISAGTIRYADLDGSSPGTLLTQTSGWDCYGIGVLSDHRVVFTETDIASPASKRLRRCDNDGTNLTTFTSNGSFLAPLTGILRGVALKGDTDAFVVNLDTGESQATLLKINIDTDDLFIASRYNIDRSLLGVSGADGIGDIAILQIIDPNKRCSHYAFWFVGSETAILMQNGYFHSTIPGIPSFWVTNSRDADSTPEVPVSKSPYPADYLPQASGIDTPRGGVIITDGGEPICEASNLGSSPETPSSATEQNEIQVIDIGTPSSGTFTIVVDNGAVGNQSTYLTTHTGAVYNLSAADLKTILETDFGVTSSEFTVTGSDGGPWTVEFTGDLANTPIPLIEVYDDALDDASGILPTDRTQEGRGIVGEIVEEVHSLEVNGFASEGTITDFGYDVEIDEEIVTVGPITRSSSVEDIKAAFADAYDVSNLEFTLTGQGTTTWNLVIRYSGDYAGKTFNVPRFTTSFGTWISTGTKKHDRVAKGNGFVAETETLPKDLGVGKPDSPLVLNYVLGDTIQKVEWTSSGPIALRLNDKVTEAIEEDVGAAGMKAAIEALENTDYVVVQYDSGNARYIIRFRGIWAGKCVSTLTVEDPVYPESETSPPTPGAATVTVVQEGGTDTGAMVILRPAGLPRPLTPHAEIKASGAIEINATVSYKFSFVSKDLRLESPVSDETERIGLANQAGKLKIPIPNTMWFNDTIPADAGGVDAVNHIQMISHINIFRRKFGSVNRTNTKWQLTHNKYNDYLTFTIDMPNGDTTGEITMNDNEYDESGGNESSSEEQIIAAFGAAGYDVLVTRANDPDQDDSWIIEFIGDAAGTLIPLPQVSLGLTTIGGTGVITQKFIQQGGVETPVDGLGSTGDWLFLDQIAIDPNRVGNFQYYIDTTGDIDFTSDTPAPPWWYPPARARFGCIHKGQANYATGLPGDYNIWKSELAQQGSLRFGQLGFEYVRLSAFEEISQKRASDAPLIGMKSFEDVVLIGSTKEIIVGEIQAVTSGESSRYRVIEGAVGFASQHAIVEARDFRQATPQLVWIASNGHIYAYAQGVTTLLSNKFQETAKTLIRRSWHKDQEFDDQQSWMFCTAAVDPFEDRVIFTSIVDSTGLPIQIVYDMKTGGLVSWNIGARLIWTQREWDANDGQVFRDIICLAIGTTIYKMRSGLGDDGDPFSWYFETGDIAASVNPFDQLLISSACLEFDLRSFGGADPTLQLSVYGDIAATAQALYTQEKRTPDGGDVGSAFAIESPNGRAITNIPKRCRRARLRVAGTHVEDATHPELASIYLKVEVVDKPNK